MEWDCYNFTAEKNEAFLNKIDEDLDYAFALSLQEEFSQDLNSLKEKSSSSESKVVGIVDDQWELLDPNPDIHALFLQYNSQFFYGKLDGVEVRWSPRMTLCAGLCCYEGRGGLCSVRLSLPLLKLRPRRDLVETLLHEMIHAYLFVTANNKDHDAHGPEFLKHMNRINTETGTKISVYHSFHDEVESYRSHWWKCSGPCQHRRPFYGVVKRAMNRAPGPRDPWFAAHQSSCGGTFTKVKEPADYKKAKGSSKDSLKRKPTSKDADHQQSNIKKFFKPPSSSTAEPCSKNIHGFENSELSTTNNSYSVKEVASAVTPFVGRGFRLGSSSEKQPPRTFLAGVRSELAARGGLSSQPSCSSRPKKESCVLGSAWDGGGSTPKGQNKTNEAKKLKSHKKSNGAQTSLETFLTSPPRERNNLSTKSLGAHPSSRVKCPVCLQSFSSDAEINVHLDSCLQSE